MRGSDGIVKSLAPVIARSEATKQASGVTRALDCFTPLAMAAPAQDAATPLVALPQGRGRAARYASCLIALLPA